MTTPVSALLRRTKWSALIACAAADDSPEGRRRERHRRVALSFASSGLARIISITSALIVVPLSVRYLGDVRYGIWATITAIAGLLGFADLGLGGGVVSEVADATGRDDDDAVAASTASAFFVLAGIALTLGTATVIAYPFIPWNALFNSPNAEAYGADTATAIFLATLLLSLPLGVAQRVHMGYQEIFVVGLWQAAGTIIGLGGVVVTITADAGLPALVLAASGGPVLALFGNSVVLFRRRPMLRPRLRLVSKDAARRLLRIGSLFFVLQLAMAFAYETDAIVLTQILGPESVTVYSVTMRVFLIVPGVIGFALTPLWPAYGEAISRGDTEWVRATFRRSFRAATVMGAVGSSVLVFAAGPLVPIWSGAPRPPLSLLIGACVWTATMCISGALAMFMNGARVIGFQIKAALAMTALNIMLSIGLTKAVGVSGVVWGSAIAQWTVVIIPSLFVVRSELERLRRSSTGAAR